MAAPRLLQPHAAFVRLRRSRAALSPAIPGRWPVLPRIRPAPEGGRQGPHCGGRLSWRWPVITLAHLGLRGQPRFPCLPVSWAHLGCRSQRVGCCSSSQLVWRRSAFPARGGGPGGCISPPIPRSPALPHTSGPARKPPPQPLPGAFRASHAALREQGVRSIQFCNWGILRPRLPGAAAGSLSSRPHPGPLTPGAA